MAKTGNSKVCVLTLALQTQPWQEKILEKRFAIIEQLENALISKQLHRLYELQRTREYRELMKQIDETPKNKRGQLWKKRSELLKDNKFSKYDFINAITPMQKHFAEHIAAQVAHRASTDVWRAFDKYLYHGGKHVHFKKRGTLSSVACEKAGNGMHYDKNKNTFRWSGGRSDHSITLEIPVSPPKTPYEKEMLQYKIKYLRVLRKWSKRRYKYYLQFTLAGAPVTKPRELGTGRVGIDIGPQTVAIAGAKNVMLLELADRVDQNHIKLRELQRKMDRSKRSTNPGLFEADGTIKRGVKLRWKFSNHYMKMSGQIRELQRKNAAIRKYQHICLANRVIALGTDIIVEDMDFRALQRRAKKTTINKNGRYNRKKRYGKSLANKAPSEFLAILSRKLIALDKPCVHKVDKWNYRASQYDHISGEYHKKGLNVRWTVLANNDTVQRDLYAAFLLMNTDENYLEPNRELCTRTYSDFKKLHDTEIERIRSDERHYPSSFGFAV